MYASMDRRLVLKYEQLPDGEQVGKRPQGAKQADKSVENNFKLVLR